MAEAIIVHTPEELTEIAWKLIDEALTRGKMTLESGADYELEPVDLVNLAKWLAVARAKKPKPVSIPEDFKPKVTGGSTDAR